MCLLPNLIFAQTINTDNPNVYLKNFTCDGDYATFNVVNKSSKSLKGIRFDFFDQDGDPIDNLNWDLIVASGVGEKFGKYGCGPMTKYKFITKTYYW